MPPSQRTQPLSRAIPLHSTEQSTLASGAQSAGARGGSSARRYALWVVASAALSLALYARSVGHGLYFDDWGLVNQARHGESHLQLRNDAEELSYRTRTRDEGWMPWFTDVGAKIAILRPLPIQSHVAEFRAFPERVDVMHAINLAWWAAAIAAFAWLARRLTSSYLAAALAVLFYAVEDGHGAAIEWIAGRNSMMTATFGCIALAAHDAWRRGRWRPGAWLGPLSLALALLSSESALCIVAYLACYTLLVDPAAPRERLKGALPWIGATVAYVIFYKLAGYGVRGIGLYVDPLAQPGTTARSLALTAPVLLVTKLLGAPTLAWPPLQSRAAVLAMLVAIAAVLVPLLRRHPHVRFWAAGLVLAQLPVAGTTPHVRLFMVTSLGGAVLAAELVARCHPRELAGRSALVRVGVIVLGAAALVAHGPVSALALGRPAKIDGVNDADALDHLYGLASSAIRGAKPDQRVVIVNSPRQMILGSGITMRKGLGQPHPLSARILFPAAGEAEIRRYDARTLMVRADTSFFGSDWPLYRAGPAAIGDTSILEGMSAQVVEIDRNGGPTAVAFTFDRPLEDPQLVWRQWKDGRFIDFSPPALGEVVRVTSALP